jgi:hypothetical protein
VKIPKLSKNQYKPESGEISIVKIDNFGKASFYERDLREQKQFIKFVKNVEKIVRGSIEYKRYVGYLKNELNIKQCTFLPQVNIEEIKGVGLEFHHYPFTLYDIVSIVVNQYLAQRTLHISPFLIANDVMELHYENKVGLIPLSKTVHDLAHAGEIMIPLNLIFGDVKGFIEKYQLGMTEENRSSLRTLIQMTQKLGEDYKPDVLNKNITHIEIEEYGEIQRIPKEEKNLA